MNPDNQKNRDTLKEYFKKGKIPTEAQFAELIDSVHNIVEDGQPLIISDGWTITVTPEKILIIKNEKDETVIEIAQDKTVTIHGSLKIEGGGGGEEPPVPLEYISIPADKKWHDLPLEISHEGFGCRVYSIYASCRQRGSGLYSLTRLTALWQNFMDQKIESSQKHWWGWSGSLRFRWTESNGKTCLQMRSKKKLPGEVHCRIVEIYKA